MTTCTPDFPNVSLLQKQDLKPFSGKLSKYQGCIFRMQHTHVGFHLLATVLLTSTTATAFQVIFLDLLDARSVATPSWFSNICK